jgi:hypothetical protein
MLAALVGLSMLLALAGGIATLTGCLLAPRLRARQARRHPQRAAMRERTRQARRLAAEWPLLAQTLGLGYRDQWTRQHRFPTAEFVADDKGVTATVAAIAGANLTDYQHAAAYLADTWGCVSVRAEQRGPGLIRLRGLHRDPLLAPARVDLSGMAPASLTSWWLGWAEDGSLVMVRLAEVSGTVVGGLAGFGKTMLVAHLLGQLAPSPAVQFVLIDGKGGPDYDRLMPRAWLSAKDDLGEVALWIAAGANPKEVAARAGHASVSFTLDRYGHLYPEADLSLRERLEAIMRPARAICDGLRPRRGPSDDPWPPGTAGTTCRDALACGFGWWA